MAFLCKGRKPRKRATPAVLPLFEHADENRIRELPLSARRLARRWGLEPATAQIIAELAGFQPERD